MVVVEGGVEDVVGGSFDVVGGFDVEEVGGGGSLVGWVGLGCPGVGVELLLVFRFVVVVVVVVFDDEEDDDSVVVVVGVVDREVLLPSYVVVFSTSTEVSWLVRSGWASPLSPASMATVANAVDTTTPATPSAM